MSHFAVPVSEVMTSKVVSITSNTSMPEAYELLKGSAFSALAVVDGDAQNLIGVLSRSDLLRVGRVQSGRRPDAALLTLPERPIAEVMTANPLTVDPAAPLAAAAKLMARRSVHRVFVVEGSRLVGVVSTRDVMQTVADNQMNNPISEFMSKPLFTIRATEPISLAADRLEKARVSGLVVVDDEWPVGVFTQADALLSREMPRTTAVEEVMNPAMICVPEDSKMHRAAAQALAMHARRIIACRNREAVGILSGLDFANAAQ